MFKFDESVEVTNADISTKEVLLGCYNATLKELFISKNDNNKYMLEAEFEIVDKTTGEVTTQYAKEYFANENAEPYNKGSKGSFPTNGLRVLKSIADIIDADYKQLANNTVKKVIERFGKKEEVYEINAKNLDVFVGFEANVYNGKVRPSISFIFKRDALTDEEKEKKCKALENKNEKILSSKDNSSKENNTSNDSNDKSKYGW